MTNLRAGTFRLLVAALVAPFFGTLGCEPRSESAPAPPVQYAVSLQVSTPAGLPKCAGSLAGTTAYVSSPAGLWSCLGDVWVALPCTKALSGAVAYASATMSLWACSAGAWTAVALPAGATGPAGPQGPVGATGPEGATGAAGPRGADGAMGATGASGATSLIALTPFTGADGSCASGGTRVDAGIDANGDGHLDAAEVTATSYVCAGADGAAGPQGATGAQGPAGPQGAAGPQGPSGSGTSSGQFLTSLTNEPVGPNCGNGGSRLDYGADTDGNGVLDPTEVTQSAYLCRQRPTGVKIVAGGAHTCATISNGTSRCWGNGLAGQLGNGSTIRSMTPVTVVGLTDARALALGDMHSCALLADGTTQCWGNNAAGEIANYAVDPNTHTITFLSNSTKPVGTAGLFSVTSLATGSDHTCVTLLDGTVRCWGDDSAGQLGDGQRQRASFQPVAVGGVSGAIAVAAGFGHTCALIGDGTVKCWGLNGYGQLGDNSINDSLTPVIVQGLTDAKAIAAGGTHTCALRQAGSVVCWGNANEGQLGYGKSICVSTPVPVVGLGNVTALSAGGNHTCAVLASGAARCWGSNLSGELGDGTHTDTNVPVAVAGLANVITITAGANHSCAVSSDGTAWCWGLNDDGQLGNGSTTSSPRPVLVGAF
jgi:alpha-tubulin suppressor-like RCC1 family protein